MLFSYSSKLWAVLEPGKRSRELVTTTVRELKENSLVRVTENVAPDPRHRLGFSKELDELRIRYSLAEGSRVRQYGLSNRRKLRRRGLPDPCCHDRFISRLI